MYLISSSSITGWQSSNGVRRQFDNFDLSVVDFVGICCEEEEDVDGGRDSSNSGSRGNVQCCAMSSSPPWMAAVLV